MKLIVNNNDLCLEYGKGIFFEFCLVVEISM